MIELDHDGENHEVHQIKLTDFGLSKVIVPGEVMFEACGTPAYVAPEVLKKEGYSKEIDVWSTGVIIYTMLARALPFHSSDVKNTFRMIRNAEADFSGECWHSISNECIDFIKKTLIKDPK
jgi:calcium/calmodulin-dependent protein kinase I